MCKKWLEITLGKFSRMGQLRRTGGISSVLVV